MTMDLRTRRNVLLLAACQALLMSGTSLTMTVSALVGHQMADDKSLSTLPLALQFLATMAATIPASMLMRRIGRRAGFTVGACIGVVGALTAAWGIFSDNFWLFALGGLPLGIFNGFGQFYRFAAADTAGPEHRARAISYVLTGGVIAAIVGPELANWSKDWFAPVLFAGGFMAVFAMQVMSLLLIQLLDIPGLTAAERADGGRPLLEIARQPTFIVAIVAGMIAYASMNYVMIATPLAMADCGLSFSATKLVMQAHILGMFVPSFFTGNLIKRFGVLEVMLVGAILILGCILVNSSGVSEQHFQVALLLLGLGWNFLYVGASTLLTEIPTPAERNKVQAVNDFLVFGLVSVSAFTSGAVHEWMGWQTANLGVPPLIVAAMAMLLWLRAQRRKPAFSQP